MTQIDLQNLEVIKSVLGKTILQCHNLQDLNLLSNKDFQFKKDLLLKMKKEGKIEKK